MKQVNDYLLDSLLSYLKQFARGAKNAVHTTELARKFFEDPQENDRRIRKACEILRNERHERIISSLAGGIFYALTPEEVIEYKTRMKRTIAGTQRSITAAEQIIRDLEAESNGLLFPVGKQDQNGYF